MSLIKRVPLKFSIMAFSYKNNHSYQMHTLPIIFHTTRKCASLGVKLYFITSCKVKWNHLLKVAGFKKWLEIHLPVMNLEVFKKWVVPAEKLVNPNKSQDSLPTWFIESPFDSEQFGSITNCLCVSVKGRLLCPGWCPSGVVILRSWWCFRY